MDVSHRFRAPAACREGLLGRDALEERVSVRRLFTKTQKGRLGDVRVRVGFLLVEGERDATLSEDGARRKQKRTQQPRKEHEMTTVKHGKAGT